MPPKTPEATAAAANGAPAQEGGFQNAPWNLLTPFDPHTEDVDEWAKKMMRIFTIWPKAHAPQFAVRLSFMLKGTAYEKAQLIPVEELATEDAKGLKKLITAIGGNWASSEEEKIIDLFEKAIYSTRQQADEQNLSYMDRVDVNFAKLLAKEVTIDQLQAYVTLRQSALSREKKEKLVYDLRGKIDMDALKDLFKGLNVKFGELNREQQKLKIYPVNFVEAEMETPASGGAASSEQFGFVMDQVDEDSEVEGELLQILVAEGNTDAVMVQNFEAELVDFFQETPELHTAFIPYQDARKRLSDARKNRGIWPTGQSSGKGFKGKGKGKGKGKKPRASFLALQVRTAAIVARRVIGRLSAQTLPRTRKAHKPLWLTLPTRLTQSTAWWTRWTFSRATWRRRQPSLRMFLQLMWPNHPRQASQRWSNRQTKSLTSR